MKSAELFEESEDRHLHYKVKYEQGIGFLQGKGVLAASVKNQERAIIVIHF